MKKIFLYSLSFLASASILVSCSENSWNDKYLDGFEGGPTYNDAVTVDYTLTNEDYETIGKALAASASTPDEEAAAQNIQNLRYFDQSSAYPYQAGIEYFLNRSKTSNYAIYPENSVVQVTFQAAQGVPEEVTAISTAERLIIPEYTEVSDLPGILSETFPEAEEGQYAIVSYNNGTLQSSNAVSVKTKSIKAPKIIRSRADAEITSNIKDVTSGQELSATAIVTAQSTQGVILTDNAGSILYYNRDIVLSDYPIGTLVDISGTITDYRRTLEFDNSATIENVGFQAYEYPQPVAYNASMVDAAVAETQNILATYISLEGELSVSNNYFNINIPGTEVQGSLYNTPSELTNSLSDGETYIFYGYFIGNNTSSNGTTFFNLVLTDAKPAGGNTPSEPEDNPLSSAIHNLAKGDNLMATAVVTGQCSRGLILTDNAGSILYYNQDVDLSTYPLGTVVNVSGEVDAYNLALELTKDASISIAGTYDYNYPTPVIYTGEMMDEAILGTQDMLASYSTFKGKLSKVLASNGSYYNYNITVNGATTAVASTYYLPDEIGETLDNGTYYQFYGYFVAVSSQRYFQFVLTSAEETEPDYDENILVNDAFYFNGSEWTLAEDVFVLNPTDYQAMGFDVNDLQNPENYLPLYMKTAHPYLLPGDYLVAYNLTASGAACSILINDGSSWFVNTNDLQTITAAFTKKNGVYTFTKELGVASYVLVEEDELELDRSYLIVGINVCAGPVANRSYTYGYLPSTNVSVSDNKIVLSNDNNSFEFIQNYDNDGTIIEIPDGQFLIKDSYGRFCYYDGSHASFQLTDVENPAPEISGSTIAEQYLFSATKNDDGTWKISVTNGELTRSIFYSIQYNNFALYENEDEVSVFPTLYIMQ